MPTPNLDNYIGHEHGYATPHIDNSLVLEQPFTLQLQRGEAEAYGLAVGTFHGKRLLRLIRFDNPSTEQRVWCCHPNNDEPRSLWAGFGATPQEATQRCLNKLAV